jgi:uncharacterized protein YrrD
MYNLALMLGANVYGRHKHCGQLTKIVVQPNNRQVTDIIIEDGLIFKRAIVLPVSQVDETFGQTIILKISGEQLSEFQAYGETTVEKGTSDWPAAKAVGEIEYVSLPTTNIPSLAMTREKTRLGVRSDALILDSNTNITCLEGSIGHLSRVIVDAKDHLISDLVFKQGTLFPRHYMVSTYYIDSLNEAQAQIAITRSEADQLAEYTFLQNR